MYILASIFSSKYKCIKCNIKSAVICMMKILYNSKDTNEVFKSQAPDVINWQFTTLGACGLTV